MYFTVCDSAADSPCEDDMDGPDGGSDGGSLNVHWRLVAI